MDVSVIIVNYNTCNLVKNVLLLYLKKLKMLVLK